VLLGQGTLGYQTYKPSATGGVVRSADQHYADAPSVKDFGAKGTGGATDDTLAFQHAVDAQPAGGSLFVPPGTYNIVAPSAGSGVVITKPLTITCAGSAATLIQGTAAAWALVYVGASNVTIQGCHFDGTNAGNAVGIATGATHDLHFENNSFTNLGMGMDLTNVQRVWIENSYFFNMPWSGIRFEEPGSGHSTSYAWVLNNVMAKVVTSHQAGHAGIYVDSGDGSNRAEANTHYTITGNHIEAECVGINAGADESVVSGNRLTGDGLHGECIAGGGTDITYSHNEANSCGASALLLWSGPWGNQNINVEGNSFWGSPQGVSIVWGSQGSHFEGIHIVGNTMTGNTYGILSYFGYDPIMNGTVTAGTWSRVLINGNDLSGPLSGNYLLHSEQIDDPVWTKRGTATVVRNAAADFDGFVPAPDESNGSLPESVTLDVYPNDMWQSAAVPVPAGSYSPSFWIKRISTTGGLSILNTRDTASGTQGWWEVDLSAIGSRWVRLTPSTPGVTVHSPFISAGGNDGLYIRAWSSGTSFYMWGAQVNLGALPEVYYRTTTAAVTTGERPLQVGGGAIQWDNITASAPTVDNGMMHSISGAVPFVDGGTGLTADNPNWLFVKPDTGFVGIGLYPGWPPVPQARLHVQGTVRFDWNGPSSTTPNLLVNSVYAGGYLAPAYIGLQSSGTPLGEIAADTGTWFRFHGQHESVLNARDQFAVFETSDLRRFGLGPWGASFYNVSTTFGQLNAPVSPMAEGGAGLQPLPTAVYCSDCGSVANVCTTGGTGAWAFYTPITHENWLIDSQHFYVRYTDGSQIVWMTRGVGSATDNTVYGPDGTLTGATITTAKGFNDLYQNGWYGGMPTPLPVGPFTPSIWISPSAATPTGIVALSSPNGTAQGYFTVDLSKLAVGKWTRVAPGAAGVTVITPFSSLGNRSDGLDIGVDPSSTVTPLTFYAWGAQINEGNSALGYVATTTTQAFQPGGAQATWYCPTAAPAVASVFGRTGAVAAQIGDYTAAQVTNAVDSTQSYNNPSWLTGLAYSKVTGFPAAPVASVFGRTGAVVAASGDYTAVQVTNAVDSTQSYNNPSWLTGLAYSKISGAPSTQAPTVQGTRAARASTSATPDGLLYRETDTGLTYMALSSQWVYEAGVWSVTQSQIAGLGLGQYDSGLRLAVSDFAHTLLWTWSGSSGTLGWAPGDPESGWVQTFAVAPAGAWWHVVDGTAITYLKADGTVGTVTPGSMTGGVYAKYGAAFTGTVNAASTVGGTIGAEASHTHTTTVAAGTTGAPSALDQAVVAGASNGGENYLAYSQQFAQAGTWAKPAGVTITDNAVVAPDGNTTAATIVGLDTSTNNVYQAQTIPAGSYIVSIWVYPVSTTGVLRICNPRGCASYGEYNVDLSQLPASTWTRIQPGAVATTLVHPFVANGGVGQDGIRLMALSGAPLSVNVWGAQANLGTLALPYQVTTVPNVKPAWQYTRPEAAVAHTHSTAAQNNITSSAGSSHTHTFTGAATGDPINEVFLPYFRR
jgi:hypothetical protein